MPGPAPPARGSPYSRLRPRDLPPATTAAPTGAAAVGRREDAMSLAPSDAGPAPAGGGADTAVLLPGVRPREGGRTRPALARLMDRRPHPRLRRLADVLAERASRPPALADEPPPVAPVETPTPAWEAALAGARSQVGPVALRVLAAVAEVLDGRRPAEHLGRDRPARDRRPGAGRRRPGRAPAGRPGPGPADVPGARAGARGHAGARGRGGRRALRARSRRPRRAAATGPGGRRALRARHRPDDVAADRAARRVSPAQLRAGAPWHCLYLRPDPQGQGALRDGVSARRAC